VVGGGKRDGRRAAGDHAVNGQQWTMVFMVKSQRIAVYPGSFDPLTNGHVDIIRRGARLFDRIVVAILVNEQKTPMFTTDERVAMVREEFAGAPTVGVDTFQGLLVNFAERQQASAIVRGLRAVSDFEYEFQMALMNRRLSARVETEFMMPAAEYSYISSRLVKEVVMLGGSVEGLVPPGVERRLKERRRIGDR
jgi:pantetheine-phosphate adenylyltransferase